MRWLSRSAAVAVVIAAVLGLAAFQFYQSWLDRPFGDPAQGYLLAVPEGSTIGQVAGQLAGSGLFQYPRLLELHARLRGEATRIRAGEYALHAGETPRLLLDKLVSGQVLLHALTVVEGWTVRELLAALWSHPAISRTLETADPVALATTMELPVSHAEGQFFPDTYRFARGTTDLEFLRRAHDLMDRRLAAAWEQRQPDLPYNTPYEALILASIIERETALDTERRDIAGVFVRRLQKNMRLQTDPTVIYGLGDSFDGNLTRRHLTTDTPYNTYTRSGLPPTPIALPGEAALLAAVTPAPGDALFFVATGRPDGSHAFTSTLEAHNAKVAEYLATLKLRNGAN